MNNPYPLKQKEEEKKFLDYSCEQTRANKYALGLVVRAEMHRRGLTYADMFAMVKAYAGNTGNPDLLRVTLNGNAWSRSLNLIWLCGYILGITFSLDDINKAKAYLIGIGRSVKNF